MFTLSNELKDGPSASSNSRTKTTALPRALVFHKIAATDFKLHCRLFYIISCTYYEDLVANSVNNAENTVGIHSYGKGTVQFRVCV